MKDIKQQVELPERPRPIVIIGAGGIVNDAHLPAYQMAGFPLLGIFDIDVDKAKALQNKFKGIKTVYDSLAEMIEDAKANEAIYDMAVPADHIGTILERLPDRSGVLIQKPMGKNLGEAQKIREICGRKKLVSALNFQLRYAPYTIAARHMIDTGLIGDVYDMELKVCVFTPWHLWNFLYASPRVEILYHSIHYLDLIRSFLGNPKRIDASSIKHPKMPELAQTRSTMILDYDDYTQARIITNHGHFFGPKNQESYLKIEGTKGAIKIQIGLSLDYPKGRPPLFEYIVLNGDGKGEWRELALQGGWFPHAFMGPMAILQRHVADKNVSLPHSTEDAYETMRLVEAAYRSNEKGGIEV